jgi:hypothetical protein
VGLFVAPSIRTEGWQLSPMPSLEAIRLVEMLGGQGDRDLCAATLPFDRVPAMLERINLQTLHARPKECPDSARQLASELSTKLGQRVSPGVPRDKSDRWGRLVVSRTGYTGNDGTRRSELRLRVVTFPTRDFTQRRLGARLTSETYNAQASAAMDLGEAVQTAVERGLLPLLLSTEAAGHLKDKTRGPDEGPTRSADHHHLGRAQRHHPPPGGRAGGPRAASTQARRSQGDTQRRRSSDGADDRRPATRGRPDAARSPAQQYDSDCHSRLAAMAA